MKVLKITTEARAYSEEEAKDYIEEVRLAAGNEYEIKKAGYEYKTKKSKGEIIDSGYVVTIVKIFNDFWD